MFLVLGAVALVVPVLPTTPFVMISAACFSCNRRLFGLVMRIPFFREHYENYRYGGGLSRRTFVLSLVTMWCAMAVSIALGVAAGRLWLVALLVLVGIAVTVHLVCMSRRKRTEASVCVQCPVDAPVMHGLGGRDSSE